MPLSGNLTDEPDWVFNGQYAFAEDRVGLVQSVTELVAYTTTGKTHLILATPDLRQWYADVTLHEPTLNVNPLPVEAPAVIRATDGRLWKAIQQPQDPVPLPTEKQVSGVAGIAGAHDANIAFVHLLNNDADQRYFLDPSNPAPDPVPPEAPNVIVDASGRRWSRINKYEAPFQFMQNAELT